MWSYIPGGVKNKGLLTAHKITLWDKLMWSYKYGHSQNEDCKIEGPLVTYPPILTLLDYNFCN